MSYSAKEDVREDAKPNLLGRGERGAALAAAALVLYWAAADIRLYGLRSEAALAAGESTMAGTAGMMAALLIGTLLASRLDERRVLASMLLLPVIAALVFLGATCELFVINNVVALMARFVAGAGLGTVLFLAGVLLVEVPKALAGTLAAGSLACGKFLFFCISASPRYMLVVLDAVFLLLAAVLLAWALFPIREKSSQELLEQGADSGKSALMSFSIGLFFYSIIYGTMVSLALSGVKASDVMSLLGAVMAVSAVVVSAAVLLKPRFNIELFQWWLFVPIAACLLLVIVAPFDGVVALLAVVVVFTLYDCSSMVSLISIAESYPATFDRSRAFALGRIANIGGMFVGSALYAFFIFFCGGSLSDGSIAFLISAEFICLILGMAFLGRTSFGFSGLRVLDRLTAEATEAVIDPASDKLLRTSARLAEIYGLSERESAALDLLRQGRSSAVIAERLCVSQSTAKTYIYRIYQKFGVHSRQELLDLIESDEPPHGLNDAVKDGANAL